MWGCSQIFRLGSGCFEHGSESIGIDSESLLFAKLQEYKLELPHLISRRQYNDRRKFTTSLCSTIREKITEAIDGGEDCFCIDSKPIEICRPARTKRCSMGKNDIKKSSIVWLLCISRGLLLRL